MVFKKCRENPKDILFIDASQHFEKVKTQNILRHQDIEKIITTYSHRTTEAKYSYLAPMEEVAENDFNLNIPRYVDTFVAEDKIDINAIANKIKALDHSMIEIDNTIADFCKQLNIQTPF